MDDTLLKLGEMGALGFISMFLLMKGTSAIKELADSNKLLADSVNKLSDKVNSLDNRLTDAGFELRKIAERLDKIENFLFRSDTNVIK